MRAVAVVRPDAEIPAVARARLLRSLRGALPRIEVLDDGALACDLRGTARLLGEPLEIGRRIVALGERAGIPVAVGIATGRFAARMLAARTALGSVAGVVADTRAFLAPLPVRTLPLDQAVIQELALLGIRDIAAFAALDPGAVLDRFGRAAAAVHALARGHDDAVVRGDPPRRRIRAARRFDAPLDSTEQLAFALRALADAVADALRADGLAALRLAVRAERAGTPPLTTRGTLGALLVERTLLPPTADPAGMVRSLRWALEERGDLGPVEAVALEVLEVEPLRGRQLGLFAPDGAGLEEAIAVAQHLRGRLGPGTVLRPAHLAPDARLPEREADWAEAVV